MSSSPELEDQSPGGQMLIHQDGGLKLQVRLDGQTVWLTQTQLGELYQTSKQNISLHIQNILEENELRREAVVKEYLTTAADGKRYRTLHYSLDMILAVGYRVRSPRGTLFRQWATARLSELLVKGFTLDGEGRAKKATNHVAMNESGWSSIVDAASRATAMFARLGRFRQRNRRKLPQLGRRMSNLSGILVA